MKRTNRVSIIGIGAVNPQGVGIQEVLKNKCTLPEFNVSSAESSEKDFQVAYIKVGAINTAEYLPGISIRCTDRTTIYSGVASSMAIGNYISSNAIDSSQVGMALGSALGSVVSISNFNLQALAEGPSSVSPMEFPNTVSNAPASKVGIWFSLKGPSVSISNGFTSGLDAIGFAFDEISYGKAQYYLAGGSEELSENVHTGYASVIANKAKKSTLSSQSEVIVEGSGVLFLSSTEEAISKGFELHGEIVDFYSGKIVVDNGYVKTVMSTLTAIIESNEIQENDIMVYTSMMPFNELSTIVYAEALKQFGNDKFVICNQIENTYLNYLGMNGVFNLIYALHDLKSNPGKDKNALIFDIGCDGKLSCIIVK